MKQRFISGRPSGASFLRSPLTQQFVLLAHMSLKSKGNPTQPKPCRASHAAQHLDFQRFRQMLRPQTTLGACIHIWGQAIELHIGESWALYTSYIKLYVVLTYKRTQYTSTNSQCCRPKEGPLSSSKSNRFFSLQKHPREGPNQPFQYGSHSPHISLSAKYNSNYQYNPKGLDVNGVWE